MWSALSWGLPHRDRILKAVRTPALSSFCSPLSSAQRSRLHLRDSLFTTRREREGEREEGGKKRRKGKERKEASTRSFRAARARSTTTEVLRNLTESAVSYFERSLRLSFGLIGTSKVKLELGRTTVGNARSRVGKRGTATGVCRNFGELKIAI